MYDYPRQFTSVDPAPPLIAHSPLAAQPSSTVKAKVSSQNTITDIKSLRSALLDTHLQLFTRYRAMFALRNIGTAEAIDALCAGFDDDSALFK
jgi:deoxyhypusine monooxygenase